MPASKGFPENSANAAKKKTRIFSENSSLLHSAVRLKSRRPSTPAADTTTSPPPAAAGSGKTPQNTTQTRHLTPSEAFHRTHTHALRLAQPSHSGGSRVKTQRKNKRLITAASYLCRKVFLLLLFLLLLDITSTVSLRR